MHFNGLDSKQIYELKNMVNLILKNLQRTINVCDVIPDSCAEVYQESDAVGFNDQDEEVNYIGAQCFYQNRGHGNNFMNNSNMSFINPNVENPQNQVHPPQNKPFQPKSQNPNSV